ncbi:MAG: peptide chain release factor 1 [Oscillospiraceae bacterium]|nr:peptide chain release factor 1 [Oscillospiraceae bacterium]
MFDKLKSVEDRYEEINKSLMDPAAVSDNKKYTALMRELKNLSPVVEKYREYTKSKDAMDEAAALLAEGGHDREFREMLDTEITENRRKIEEVTQELTILLLPRDPNDDKNVIVEIRGGAGGDEAALFSAVLYRMYSMYAEARRWKCEILTANQTGLGGYKEVSFSLEGDGAYSRLKFESGVHRVQRVPETESQGRVHTSTVTVAVLAQAEEVEVEINPADLQIDTYRAGGAGGQHVNKTESAIRITHLPTGLVVECQDERSQHKNKDKAMRILRSRLYEKMQREQADKIAGERKLQVGTGDRSERIRTYNFPQSRVTDHRINFTLYKLEQMLNGDLDELLDALITYDQAEKLQASAGNV